MTPAETRVAILHNGYVPIPASGKACHIKGWSTKTATNAEEIEVQSKQYRDHSNTGILTRNAPGVDIDITIEPAAIAVEELAREEYEERGPFLVRIGQAPKRLVLLRTDEPFKKLSRVFEAPDGSEQKIEVLGDGQQAIVHGIHPGTGKPYSWHGGSPITVPRGDLPYVRSADLVAFLDKAAAVLVEQFGFRDCKPNGQAPGGGDATGEQREPADWAALIGNIIAGRDLHDSTLKLAGAYISSGMDERGATRAIEALFLTSDCPRDERWKNWFKDIARGARDVWEKHGRIPRGPERTQPANLPSGEELKAMHFEPIKYVVPGVIVEGLTLFAGKPKTYKSWLVLHAAIAVAQGGFTLGEIHCIEGDVLYCALEDNLRRLKSRMSKLLGMDADWPKRVRFLTEMPRLADGGLGVIKEWIKSVASPRLVVIDTLAMVRAAKKRDENPYDADYAAVKDLRALAAEYGIAIVLVHHLRKADADDAFDTVSGTLGLTGAVDATLVLKRETSGGFTMHGRGRDLIELEKAMSFNRDTCTWTITGSASEARSSRERTAILDALGAHGEAATPAEISALAGLKHGSVKHLVLKMAKDGLLKRNDKGRYGLARVNG